MNDFRYLVCPETNQDLFLLDSQQLAEINKRINSKNLKKISGEIVDQKLENGLIRSDKKVVYPVSGQIPILTKEEGILL